MEAFNALNYNPNQSGSVLPIGKYPVIIESSEVKPNKENNGGYLQLNLKIIDGEHKGGGGVYRLNLYNQSQQAVEIAHNQLSSVCHVISVFNITDSSQLHDIPFIVEVGPQKNDAKYTEVKKVFDICGNEPGKQNQSAPTQPQAPKVLAQAPAAAWSEPIQPQTTATAWNQTVQAHVNNTQQHQAQSSQQAQSQPAWGVQPQQPPSDVPAWAVKR